MSLGHESSDVSAQPSKPDVPSPDPSEDLASEAKARWRGGESADARALVDAHPDLNWRKSVILDLAYEEYCQLVESSDSDGNEGVVETILERFPTYKHSLLKQIEVHEYLKHDPAFLIHSDQVEWPELGSEILGFTVQEELGRGSFGRVYLCIQPELGSRQVVVKFGFFGAREAFQLGKLAHRYIVPVYSVDEDDDTGLAAICMPFLGRSTADDLLDDAFADGVCPNSATMILDTASRKHIPTDRIDATIKPDAIMRNGSYVEGVTSLGVRLSEALQHAHDRGIRHGDIKPSNILITLRGDPVLLDFNLSGDEQSPGEAMGGTLPYMAPEQIRSALLENSNGDSPVDAKSEIFSLGVVLYQLLSGKLPFGPMPAKSGFRDVANRLLECQCEGPASLGRMNRDVDPQLAAVIENCLNFDPALRPTSMASIAKLLRDCISVRARLRRTIRNHPRTSIAAAFCLSLVVTYSVIYFATRPPIEVREFHRGMDHYAAQRYDAAIPCFDSVVKADPSDAKAYYLRGRCFLGQKQFRLAREDFRAAKQLRIDARFLASLGYVENVLGNHRTALNAYQQAIANGLSSAGLYNNVGYSHLQSRIPDRFDRAKEALDKAIRLNSNQFAAYFNRAILHQRRSELAAAAADIKTALKYRREDARLHVTAASLFAQLLPTDSSYIALVDREIVTATDLEPANVTLRVQAAYLFEMLSKHDPIYADDVRKQVKAAIQLSPKNVGLHSMAAKVFRRLEKLDPTFHDDVLFHQREKQRYRNSTQTTKGLLSSNNRVFNQSLPKMGSHEISDRGTAELPLGLVDPTAEEDLPPFLASLRKKL